MADTFKTRDQLIKRALKVIGQIEPGEEPAIEDYTTIDDLIDPLIAQLAAEGIVYIGDTDEIELQFYFPIARILANIAGPDFGSPINEDAKLTDERLLRKITATTPTYQPLKGQFF